MSDAFVPVAALADLAPGEAIDVVAGGIEIALVRDEDGGVHAIEDRCSHEDVPLSDGDVEGCTLECWKHGSQFDLRTGRPLQLPARQRRRRVLEWQVEPHGGERRQTADQRAENHQTEKTQHAPGTLGGAPGVVCTPGFRFACHVRCVPVPAAWCLVHV